MGEGGNASVCAPTRASSGVCAQGKSVLSQDTSLGSSLISDFPLFNSPILA